MAPAVIIAAYRLLIASLILGPVSFGRNREIFTKIGRKDWILCLMTGLILAIHFMTWVLSVKYTSVASAVVLVSMHPIFVAIGARAIYKNSIDSRAVLSMIIAFTGIGVMGIEGLAGIKTALLGDALALMAAMAFAAYLLAGQGLRRRMPAIPYAFLVYTAAGLVLLGTAAVMNVKLYPYPQRDLMVFVALAIIPTIVGHTSVNWALGHVRAMAVSMISLSEPVAAIIIASLLLREFPSMTECIGAAITLLGTLTFLLHAPDRRRLKV